MTKTSEEKSRLKLNLPRLLAGTLAAVTAAALSSRLGVAGTLAGTGLVSLVSGAAATVYEHSVERGRVAMRKAVDGFYPPRPLTDEPAEQTEQTEQTRSPRIRVGSGRRWALAGAGAIATFAVAVGIVTGIEVADGQSLSGTGHQTTLGSAFSGSRHKSTHEDRQPTAPPSSHSTGTPSTSPSTSPSTASNRPTETPSTGTSSSSRAPKSSAPTSNAPSTTTPPTTTAPTQSQTPTQAPSSP